MPCQCQPSSLLLWLSDLEAKPLLPWNLCTYRRLPDETETPEDIGSGRLVLNRPIFRVQHLDSPPDGVKLMDPLDLLEAGRTASSLAFASARASGEGSSTRTASSAGALSIGNQRDTQATTAQQERRTNRTLSIDRQTDNSTSASPESASVGVTTRRPVCRGGADGYRPSPAETTNRGGRRPFAG